MYMSGCPTLLRFLHRASLQSANKSYRCGFLCGVRSGMDRFYIVFPLLVLSRRYLFLFGSVALFFLKKVPILLYRPTTPGYVPSPQMDHITGYISFGSCL